MLPQLEWRDERSFRALMNSVRNMLLLDRAERLENQCRAQTLQSTVRSSSPKLVVFRVLSAGSLRTRVQPWATHLRFTQARTIHKEFMSDQTFDVVVWQSSQIKPPIA